jgi:hypothetical protein
MMTRKLAKKKKDNESEQFRVGDSFKRKKKWNLLIWVIVVAIISYNCDPTRWN